MTTRRSFFAKLVALAGGCFVVPFLPKPPAANLMMGWDFGVKDATIIFIQEPTDLLLAYNAATRRMELTPCGPDGKLLPIKA